MAVVVFAFACKKQVDFNPTEQETYTYCTVPADMEGGWSSDSVHITTEIDSTDTTIIDRFPTLQYRMVLRCEDDTLFYLFYENFSGVRTDVIRSAHFIAEVERVKVFDPLDPIEEADSAEFVLPLFSLTDSTVTAVLQDRPNAETRTETRIFFRKD